MKKNEEAFVFRQFAVYTVPLKKSLNPKKFFFGQDFFIRR